MIETVLLSAVLLLAVVCAFFPDGCGFWRKPTSPKDPRFLAKLKDEIEATLFPRPTDSVLQRHYDALVAAKVQNRLAMQTKSY